MKIQRKMVGKEKDTSPRRGTRRTTASSRLDKSPSRSSAQLRRPKKVSSDSASSPSPKRKPRSPQNKPSKAAAATVAAPAKSKPPPSPSRTRTRKSPPKPAKEREPVKKRPQIIKIVDSESDSDAASTSSMRTRSRSRRTLSREPNPDIVNNLRARVRRDNADIYSSRPAYEPVKKLTEFSDEDDREFGTQLLSEAKPSLRLQLGAVVAALAYCGGELGLTYLIPLLCNERRCGFRLPVRGDLDDILASFDLSVFFGFASFVLFNGIVSIVPLGGRRYRSQVPHDSRFEYVLNALAALVVQIAALVALEAYHIPAASHIVSNYLSLVTAAVALAALLGAVVFIKSLYVRREALVAPEQGYLHRFIMGGELNPRFGPMDMKFAAFRVFIIGSILLCLCYAYQSMEMIATLPPDPKSAVVPSWPTAQLLQSVRVRPTLLVLCTLIVVYFADACFFESGLMSTMEFKGMPWGFLKCNERLVGPFLYGAIPKYVYDYNVELASWELAACTALFLAGYALYRGANSQKHAFRENPYGPLVARYESIPTTSGKKLLCSGYWGLVRHPNYLGDILLNAALARFVWPTPAVLVFGFVAAHLLLRAYVDNKRCRQRYGAAWERYCQRVPHLLVPKVL